MPTVHLRIKVPNDEKGKQRATLLAAKMETAAHELLGRAFPELRESRVTSAIRISKDGLRRTVALKKRGAI